MVNRERFPQQPDESHAEYDLRIWREKASYDGRGIVCIPQMALKMAVDESIKRLNVRVPGANAKTTYTKFFLAGQICEADVPLGVKKDDLEYIDINANSDGLRGSAKRVQRRFPYIHNWEGVARFALLDDTIPEEVFERALRGAGMLIGIGRFRPEKGGFLGRFKVEGFEWGTQAI